METLRSYFRAFGQPGTYSLRRNPYLAFGFFWGIPVPVFSILLDLALVGRPGRGIVDALAEHPLHILFLLHPFLFAAVFGAMGTVRQHLEARNRELIAQLTDLATLDTLTGLHNRRYVVEELQKTLQRSRRTNHPFAIVLFDLDGFKAVNDTQGHGAGDIVLRAAAGALQGVVREGDVLGRYGGDEFLLVTFGDLPSAMSLAARAEEAVRNRTGLGVSAGVARFPEDGATAEDLVAAADTLLAATKRKRYAERGTSRRGAEHAP
jgi:diguanylate cyclase (GGDEF)-like protein